MGKFLRILAGIGIVVVIASIVDKYDIDVVEGGKSLWDSLTNGSGGSQSQNGGSESGGGSESVDDTSVAGYNKEVYTFSSLATRIRDIYVLSNFPDDVKKLFDSFEQYVVAANNRDANSLNAAHDIMCDDDN